MYNICDNETKCNESGLAIIVNDNQYCVLDDCLVFNPNAD